MDKVEIQQIFASVCTGVLSDEKASLQLIQYLCMLCMCACLLVCACTSIKVTDGVLKRAREMKSGLSNILVKMLPFLMPHPKI